MTQIVFKRAVRERIWMMVSLAGGTGSGKTYSAMELATGLSGGKPFAVIDTENGRARHYADRFCFDSCDITAPFCPSVYHDAIDAADSAGYPVIVIDSMSHEQAGEGGLIDMAEDQLDKIAGHDFVKRNACALLAWKEPKRQHKKMFGRMLSCRAHVILCFRAEEKIEMVKNQKTNRMEAKPKKSAIGMDGWMPIAEKNLPWEATCSFMFFATNPGIPVPIKLQEQHKQFFKPGEYITRDSGILLGRWASGDDKKKPTAVAQQPAPAVEQTVSGPIEEKPKVKTVNGRPRYGFTVGGVTIGTFDEEAGKGAAYAYELTLVATATYMPGEKHNELVSLVVTEPAADAEATQAADMFGKEAADGN